MSIAARRIAGRADSVALLGRGGILWRRAFPLVLWSGLAVVLMLFVALPVAQLERLAFVDGASAFARMRQMPDFGETLRVTIILAVSSSILAVVLGTGVAWAAAMLPPRVRSVGQLIPLLPLLLPGAAAVLGWMFLLSPTVGYLNTLLRQLPWFAGQTSGPFDVYTVPWIVIVTGLVLSSFVYVFVHTGFENLGEEMEAAAATSGAGPVRRLLTITIPLLMPSILLSGGIVFLLGMGQFTVPLILGRNSSIDVLTTKMFFLLETYPIDFGLGAALGFPILVAGLLLVVVQKSMIGDQRRFVVVSGQARHQQRRASWWGAAVVVLYGMLATGLPLVALIYVSLTPYWRGDITAKGLGFGNYQTVLNDPIFMQSIWTSIQASVAAVVLVIIVGFACATALHHATRIWRPLRLLIDFFVTLPFAIPATLLGFGFLFAYTGPPLPLYGTPWVLVVTYVALMIGYSTRMQFTTLLSIGNEFREAAATCGSGTLRTLIQITMPIARRGIGATGVLTFVLLFHEFSASLMVRSVKTQVIGSVMYDALTGGIYGHVAVLALIMVLVTVVGVWLAMFVSGFDALRRV